MGRHWAGEVGRRLIEGRPKSQFYYKIHSRGRNMKNLCQLIVLQMNFQFVSSLPNMLPLVWGWALKRTKWKHVQHRWVGACQQGGEPRSWIGRMEQPDQNTAGLPADVEVEDAIIMKAFRAKPSQTGASGRHRQGLALVGGPAQAGYMAQHSRA